MQLISQAGILMHSEPSWWNHFGHPTLVVALLQPPCWDTSSGTTLRRKMGPPWRLKLLCSEVSHQPRRVELDQILIFFVGFSFRVDKKRLAKVFAGIDLVGIGKFHMKPLGVATVGGELFHANGSRECLQAMIFIGCIRTWGLFRCFPKKWAAGSKMIPVELSYGYF